MLLRMTPELINKVENNEEERNSILAQTYIRIQNEIRQNHS